MLFPVVFVVWFAIIVVSLVVWSWGVKMYVFVEISGGLFFFIFRVPLGSVLFVILHHRPPLRCECVRCHDRRVMNVVGGNGRR